jgi:hypothetical protein
MTAMGTAIQESTILRLFRRLTGLALLLLVIALLPDGGQMGPVRAKQAALSLITVAGIGKILYDTFYYDRFRP